MNKLNRLFLCGAVLFVCFSKNIGANEIQDINKLFKQNQHAQALKRVDVYLAKNPKDTQARFLKGLILTAQHKNNEAIGVFQSLTEDYPELPEPYNNLAVLYAGQGQYEKAKVALEMAIRNHPSYATAQENLGDIYAKMASQSYERAIQLDRTNTATQNKLALINDLFPKNKPVTPLVNATKQPPVVNGTASAPAKAVPALPNPASSTKPQVAPPGAPPARSQTVAAVTEPSAAAKNSNIKPVSANHGVEVIKTLHEWADVWSSQNVERYLAFYASDFKTPNGENRNDWEAAAKARIGTPKYIEINISNEKVSFPNDNHAFVTFHQSYRSDYLSSSFDKFILLVKQNDKWLIQEERASK